MPHYNLCRSRALFHLAACSALLLGAVAGPMYAQSSYKEAVKRAGKVESKYLHGYVNLHIDPAILTIPGQPFIAKRTRAEWAWGAGPNDPPVSVITFTVARDRLGRIYTEWTSPQYKGIGVSVSDPTVHSFLHYMKESQLKSGRLTAESCVQPLAKDLNRGGGVAPDASGLISTGYGSQLGDARGFQDNAFQDQARPDNGHRNLGRKTVNGVTAVGQLEHVGGGPVSNAPGHISPQVYTERWFSEEFGIGVLTTSQIEGQNKINISTHDIQFGDPDPALFEQPNGYRMFARTPNCYGKTVQRTSLP